MVDSVKVQKVVFETFGDRPLRLEKKVVQNGMTVKYLLYIFGNDAGAHVVFKDSIDDRAVGRNDQKVASAEDIPYTAGFPGQVLLLMNKRNCVYTGQCRNVKINPPQFY